MKTVKIIAILLLMLICTNVCVMAFTDTEDTDYEDKINLIAGLGIMGEHSDGNFGVGVEMTRSEFATVVAKIALHHNVFNADIKKNIYKDVNSDHPAWSEILMLFETGIMVGSDDAMFYPDEIIKYAEAIKTFVTISNYAQIAETKGGYPTGYMIVASEQGLLSGINLSLDAAMTRRDTAVMAANVLEMEALIFSGIGANANFTSGSGKTILSENFNVFKEEGILTGYGETSILSALDSVGEDKVSIGDEKFYKGKTHPEKYLGHQVECYYQLDDNTGRKTLITINSKSTRSTFSVSAEDILPETTKTKLSYYRNDRTLSANITENPRVIYNGKLLTILTDSDFTPNIGDVTLTDADGDGKYETIIINDYKTVVVDSVIITDNIIKARYTEEIINLDDSLETAKIIKDGVEIELSAITKWDVLSVLESKNISGEKLIVIYVSSNKVDATVSEVYEASNNKAEVTLDNGETYKASRHYMQWVSQGLGNCLLPEVDKKYTFYMDIFGQIAATYADPASKNTYGYLIGAALTNSVSQDAQFKIFSQDGIVSIYDGDNKITVNGTQYSPALAIKQLKGISGGDGDVEPQLIVYSTTANGKIREIKTAQDKTNDADYVRTDDEFTLSASFTESGVRIYKNLFEKGRYAITASTIMFSIPSDISKEDKFSIRSNMNINDESFSPPLYLYNASDGGVAEVLLSFGGGSTRHGRPAIVERVATAITEDGGIVNKIYFVGGSSSICVPERELVYDEAPGWGYKDVRLSQLSEGDIIQYITRDDAITNIRVLVKADNPMGALGYRLISERSTSTENEPNAENANQMGRVISVSEDRKFMLIEYASHKYIGTANEERETRVETRRIEGSISRYNSSKGEIEASTLQDIQKDDLIFINSFWLSSRMMVIFR